MVKMEEEIRDEGRQRNDSCWWRKEKERDFVFMVIQLWHTIIPNLISSPFSPGTSLFVFSNRKTCALCSVFSRFRSPSSANKDKKHNLFCLQRNCENTQRWKEKRETVCKWKDPYLLSCHLSRRELFPILFDCSFCLHTTTWAYISGEMIYFNMPCHFFLLQVISTSSQKEECVNPKCPSSIDNLRIHLHSSWRLLHVQVDGNKHKEKGARVHDREKRRKRESDIRRKGRQGMSLL